MRFCCVKKVVVRNPLSMASQSIQYQLYLQASRNPQKGFDNLYKLIYKPEILDLARKHLRIDRASLVSKCSQLLIANCYSPKEARIVRIPKSSGGERSISVFTEMDKLVQTAIRLVMEPIFEPVFLPCSKGYRPMMANKHIVPKSS